MNDSEQVVTAWLQQMTGRYHWISFRYEYSERERVHYIAVYTDHGKEITCPDYCHDENLFHSRLAALYPDETVLFGHADFSFKCSARSRLFSR